MENIIGFLILVVTLIISAIFAVQKKSGQNNKAEQSFQNFSNESTGNENDAERFRDLTKSIRANPFENFMDYVEVDNDEESVEKEEKVADKSREETKTDSSNKAKTSPPLQEKSGRKTARQPGLQRIIKDFDARKAIIYSEIINRKHF